MPVLMSAMVKMPLARARSPNPRTADQYIFLHLAWQKRWGEPPRRTRNDRSHQRHRVEDDPVIRAFDQIAEALTYAPPQPLDQLPYGLDTATIDFKTGERKLDIDKVKIVADERGSVRQVGNGKIEDACGDGSC